MAGQYSQDTFVVSLPEMIKNFKVFNLMKLQLTKKSELYSYKVIGDLALGDFLRRTRVDEVSRLKSILVPLTDAAPFWDLAPNHNCEDNYDSQFTELKCNYGMAEAVETNQVVFSFQHESFVNETLQIQKNTATINLDNITNVNTFTSFLFKKYPNFDFATVVAEGVDIKDFFPNNALSEITFDAKNIEATNLRNHPDQRISNFQRYGKKIAQINLWALCQATTNKNDRDIYKRRIQAGFYYLSIDTQHGRFEIFDNGGMHVGEYYFTGKVVPDSQRNRSITV